MATKKKPRAPERHAIAAAVSQWIVAERERQGITRYALGAAGSVGASTLMAIENQGVDPKLSTFVEVCKSLGKSPGAVLTKLLKELEG